MTLAFRPAARAAAYFVATALAGPAIAAPGLSWTVDCTRGQTIARALEHAPPGAKLTLTVRGTCNESVLIDRDDVVLRGDSGVPGTVRGPDARYDTILIYGNRIIISGLSITGGQSGVTAWGANNVSIVQSVIHDTGREGVKLVGSQNVWVRGSRIEHNAGLGINLERASNLNVANTTITGNAGAGLHLGERSSASAWDCTIGSNGSNGVQLFDSSHASLWNTAIAGNGTNAANDENFRNGVAVFSSSVNLGGNRIADHPSSGVRATVSTVGISDSTITGNREGVMLFLASQLVMQGGNAISSNRGFGLWLNANSTAQVSGARFLSNAGDGILLSWDSKLMFFVDSATTSGGNGGYGLNCLDTRSSVSGLPMFVTSPPNGQGALSAGCSGP